MTLTENGDLAFESTKSALVDLFFELDDYMDGSQLTKRLEAAWKDDALTTLKIIFNARSIHLGKSSRSVFYRACGWLAENHPQTLIHNLRWLVRPVIQKKAESKTKEGEDDDDAVMVDAAPEIIDDDNTHEFDVKDGGAHGYWKDLLNILVLAVNDELKAGGDVGSIFNIMPPKPIKRNWSDGGERRRKLQDQRQARATKKLKTDAVYEALCQTVARLFAYQLKADKALLASGDAKDIQKISLAAKWAPTSKGFHDKHTFIVSSIAELLHPRQEICPDVAEHKREVYLKHAREAYRRLTISPLRAKLQVVERDITAKTFENIEYDRVPSLAMNRYNKLFAEKDTARFEKYIEAVASGERKISGATLHDGDKDMVDRVSKKVKVDPLTTVMEAISHKAYAMLAVVD